MAETIEQQKILRVFRLINLLATGVYSSRKLAQLMGVNRRTICRYLELIREIGFEVVSTRRIQTEHKIYTLGRKRPPFVPTSGTLLSQILFVVQQLGCSVTIRKASYDFVDVSIDDKYLVRLDAREIEETLPQWLASKVTQLQSEKEKEVIHA